MRSNDSTRFLLDHDLESDLSGSGDESLSDISGENTPNIVASRSKKPTKRRSKRYGSPRSKEKRSSTTRGMSGIDNNISNIDNLDSSQDLDTTTASSLQQKFRYRNWAKIILLCVVGLTIAFVVAFATGKILAINFHYTVDVGLSLLLVLLWYTNAVVDRLVRWWLFVGLSDTEQTTLRRVLLEEAASGVDRTDGSDGLKHMFIPPCCLPWVFCTGLRLKMGESIRSLSKGRRSLSKGDPVVGRSSDRIHGSSKEN